MDVASALSRKSLSKISGIICIRIYELGIVRNLHFSVVYVPVLRLLSADSGGKIDTAYIERFHLTIRNSLARFIRKSMNCSKDRQMHPKAIDFFHAWYIFVKLLITDYMWSLKELLTFRVPIQ
jgi:hypothetical protein